ncbi:hypothetical protein D3C73_1438260 [compost metagenome]
MRPHQRIHGGLGKAENTKILQPLNLSLDRWVVRDIRKACQLEWIVEIGRGTEAKLSAFDSPGAA